MNKEEKIAQLKIENKLIRDTLVTTESQVSRWKELYLSLCHYKYSKKSEKEDSNIFNETEDTVAKGVLNDMPPADSDDEMKTRVKSYIRAKSKKKTMKAPENTLVTDIYHKVEKTPICEECGSEKAVVGNFVQETITFIPSSYVVVRHHYPQYRCDVCAPSEGEYKKQTPSSKNILEQIICGPSLLATIIDENMRFGLPLYRLE